MAIKIYGIIAALDEEIFNLLAVINVKETKNNLGTKFYIGELFNKKIILVKSGIGKVNAAACTQILIDLFKVDFIINIGVAGGLDNNLKIGDLVIAEDLVQYDFDTSAFGDPIGFISRLNKIFFEADKDMLKAIKKIYLEKEALDKQEGLDNKKNFLDKNKIYFGRIASGDKFIYELKDKLFIKNNFKAQCVEMEGAAIAQVCYLNKIKFIVIRSISDNSNQDSVETYKKNLDSAIKNYTELIKILIKEY